MDDKKENLTLALLYTLFDSKYELEEYMLTGSYAIRENKQNSDIDVLALSKNVNTIQLINTVHGNIRIQLVLFPYHKTHWLFMQYTDNNPIYCSMIKKGLIIKESKSKMLSELKKNMPFHNQVIDRDMFLAKGRISSLLQELNNSNSHIENTFIAFELFRLIGSILTSGYNQDNKHLGRLLNSHTNYSTELLKTLEEFTVTKDVYLLKTYIKDVLQEFGGPVNKFSTEYVSQIYEEGDLFVIQLANHSVSQEQIVDLVAEIKYNILPNEQMMVLGLNNNQYLEKGVYLFIETKDSQEWEVIYKKTNDYFNSQLRKTVRRGIRLSYPYQSGINTGIFFGGRVNFFKLRPLFISLSDYIWEERNIDALKLSAYAYIAGYIIYKKVREEQLLFKNLIDFQFNYYLLEGADPNGIYNDCQLEGVRKEIIDYYEEEYLNQEEFLVNISTRFSSEYNQPEPFEELINQIVITLDMLNEKGAKYPESMLIGIDNGTRLYHSTIDHIFNTFHLQSNQKLSILFFIKKEFEKAI